MIIIIISVILFLFNILFGYSTFNLLKKNEKLEEAIDKRDEYVNFLSEKIQYSKDQLQKIDEKGSFEADDEIGWFFQNIKAIQSILNQYIIENGENQKTEKEERT